MKLNLKHRKPIVYISLVIYILLSSFIIIESCIPGGLSRIQSDFIATISAWFVNNTTNPIIPKSIDPTGFGDITDSSYLGRDGDISNIAKGTTTLVSIPFTYPKIENNYDVYNHKYELDYVSGNKDNYTVNLSSSNGKDNSYVINMRITASEVDLSTYQINVNIGQLSYPYKFKIVDLGTPTNYESIITKTSLKIGETSKVITKLLDENRSDLYLRRCLDEFKIERHSSNESVATIDKYGVIHGISEGNATITYGKYNFDIAVNNEMVNKPSANEIALNISPDSNLNPSLLDYDAFEEEEDKNIYSTLIYASFADESLGDKTVSWEVDDNLKVKLAPFSYDDNGYPVFHDELNRECVRVCGYRKKGDVTLTCYSNNDNSVKNTVVLNVDEEIPVEMEINIKEDITQLVNEQKVVTATFSPKNVNNKNIKVECDKNDMVTIQNNNSTSVTITGLKVGNVHIKVTSLANPSLVKEFNMTFTAKQAINDDNYNDFHSFIRKSAGHFALFGITAVFGLIFFYTYFEDKKKIWTGLVISISIGLFIAALSELIQYNIPTRGGSFKDVGIDFVGYIIGTIITLGVILIITAIKKRNKK